MLDMLGLVRRDGDDEEDSSDLLIPADRQQQLLSRSIEGETENGDRIQHSNLQNNQQPQPPPNAIDDFNTQLSLDDLAPPQSVAPQTEPDRTPQLSDEYQVRKANQIITKLKDRLARVLSRNDIFKGPINPTF